jgi:hypothetical protein
MSYVRSTTIDYTTDKIGKNSASIGAVKKLDTEVTTLFAAVNELLSHFYGTTEPNNPVPGQEWYDATAGYYKKWDGASWAASAATTGIANLDEDTSPSLAGLLDCNEFPVQLTASPAVNSTWSGLTCSLTAGENLTIGQVAYLKSDGKMWLADSDAVGTTKGLVAMSTASISGDAAGIFLLYGFLRYDTFNYTVGAPLYIHTTGGVPTETQPGSGKYSRIVGSAKSADIVFFNPSNDYVKVP